MNSEQMTRRLFLEGAAGVASSRLLGAAMPGLMALAQAACSARDNALPFAVLGESEAAEMAAIAARIIPATNTPGSSEAGVIYFMDQAFGRLMQDQLQPALKGLADFQQGVSAAVPGKTLFSELDEAGQDRYLAAHDDTAFFRLLRYMTILGFFGMQSYGGNQDQVGWQLLGFVDQHAWQPPFGHYDAEYLMGERDGG